MTSNRATQLQEEFQAGWWNGIRGMDLDPLTLQEMSMEFLDGYYQAKNKIKGWLEGLPTREAR